MGTSSEYSLQVHSLINTSGSPYNHGRERGQADHPTDRQPQTQHHQPSTSAPLTRQTRPPQAQRPRTSTKDTISTSPPCDDGARIWRAQQHTAKGHRLLHTLLPTTPALLQPAGGQVGTCRTTWESEQGHGSISASAVERGRLWWFPHGAGGSGDERWEGADRQG